MEIYPLKEANGVWSTEGACSWEGCYYVYKVSVYHPSSMKVETCYANDPYARGYTIFQLAGKHIPCTIFCPNESCVICIFSSRLSADGRKTLLVNLDSDDL